jgi:Domain of unknown function DUF29
MEAVDIEHVAEEIEDLGKRDKRELGSRLTQILEHLLKLRLAKGLILEYSHRSWHASILRQQAEIDDLLRQSPSLGRLIDPGVLSAGGRCRDRGVRRRAAGAVPVPARGCSPVGQVSRRIVRPRIATEYEL